MFCSVALTVTQSRIHGKTCTRLVSPRVDEAEERSIECLVQSKLFGCVAAVDGARRYFFPPPDATLTANEVPLFVVFGSAVFELTVAVLVIVLLPRAITMTLISAVAWLPAEIENDQTENNSSPYIQLQ
jgi:hypothetical protein